jgi:hypothetical protein
MTVSNLSFLTVGSTKKQKRQPYDVPYNWTMQDLIHLYSGRTGTRLKYPALSRERLLIHPAPPTCRFPAEALQAAQQPGQELQSANLL